MEMEMEMDGDGDEDGDGEWSPETARERRALGSVRTESARPHGGFVFHGCMGVRATPVPMERGGEEGARRAPKNPQKNSTCSSIMPRAAGVPPAPRVRQRGCGAHRRHDGRVSSNGPVALTAVANAV